MMREPGRKLRSAGIGARRRALLASLVGLVGLVGLGCEGRPRADGRTEAPPKKGPAVAVLDLSAGVPEIEPPSLFGSSGRRRSFDDLIHAIDEVQADKDAVAVVVKLGTSSLGAARAQEIGAALEKLGATKKVTCHADGLGNASYMALGRGCSSLWVSPAGDVEVVGLATQIVYLRRLLADELHLSIDILQVGKFKGAEEPLTRDGPSPEARQSLTSTLADLRASWLEGVAIRKKPGIAEAVEDGPYGASKAKAVGLVDEVGYADEALAAAKTAASAVREKIAFGPGADEQPDALTEIVRALAGEGTESGPVALVRASGSIAMTSGGNGIFGGRGGIIEKELSRTLARLEKDDDVKAVVLRIDSPGGSALASDLMWHQLMKLRKKKPLVVSVGDMAASGGYYLASAGDVIFAEPMSIVGSIGVVGGKIGVGDALEKVGVHAETFAASPKPGAASRAGYESPLVKWDEATRRRVLESMGSIYELFLARIVEGRSTRGRTFTRDRVAESAEGRIFGGKEGKARGLVDELGGLVDAIAKARELASLPADAKVVAVSGKPALFEALEPRGAEERASAVAAPVSVVGRIAPDMVPFATSMAPLAEGERAVLAVPFAVVVR
jgi:protease-4